MFFVYIQISPLFTFFCQTETDEQNPENLIEVFDEEEGHHPNITTTDIEELVPAENSDVSRSRYGSGNKNCSRDCRERVGAGRYRCDSEVLLKDFQFHEKIKLK